MKKGIILLQIISFLAFTGCYRNKTKVVRLTTSAEMAEYSGKSYDLKFSGLSSRYDFTVQVQITNKTNKYLMVKFADSTISNSAYVEEEEVFNVNLTSDAVGSEVNYIGVPGFESSYAHTEKVNISLSDQIVFTSTIDGVKFIISGLVRHPIL